MKKYFFVLFFFTASFWIMGQNAKLNYRSPLAIPLELSANFGEIRPDHFHMGVDFKTNGKEGLTIHAIENGFVSRVKISPNGYGKSIYIDHPDGRTSVYAHCSSLKGSIDSLVQKIQYAVQNFEIDIYFEPNDLPVIRGQIIALSGNTGHSFAPHLHFEIRDTKSEDALNPLLFGFDVTDHKKPEIHGLRIYGITEQGYLIPGKTMHLNLIEKSHGYSIPGGTIEIPSSYFDGGAIGLALKTSDRLDRGKNKCGIYHAELRKDGNTIFKQQMDRIPFDQTRYVNDHVDYRLYDQYQDEWQKAFRSVSNPLIIYQSQNNGKIYIEPGQTKQLEYTVADAKGNRSTLKFNIKRPTGKKNVMTHFKYEDFYFPDSAYSFFDETSFLSIKRNSFYQPVLKNLSLGQTVSIASPDVPVQLPVEIGLKIPAEQTKENGWYISRTKSNGRESAIKSGRVNEWVYGETKGVGTFRLRQDSIPPKLTPSGFIEGQQITQKKLKWYVYEVGTELKDYDLFIDKDWYLLEYERKGNYLFFRIPKSLKGKKEVVLHVIDHSGNKSSWQGSLTF